MLRILLAGLMLLSVSMVQAESEADIVATRIKQFQTGLPKTHPRLMLSKTELPQLRSFVAQLRADPEGAKLWKKLEIEPAEAPLPPEPQALPEKKGANNPDIARLWRLGYDTANDAGNTAWRFSLMYLVTGEEKYGREAARWLMHLASWRADRVALRNNDEQFIQATRPMIFAYDWAYDALTPQERSTLEKTLIYRIGLLSEDQKRLFSLTKQTEPSSSLSHPMRFISTVGQGGLAMFFEHKDAPEYLAWVYEYYNRQFPVWGGADGGWAEGLDYWSSGLSQHLRFLDAMKQLGFDDPLKRGFFRNNPYFAMFNLMPYPSSSFGDLTNIVKPDSNRALLLEKYALINHDPYPLAFSRKLADRYPDEMPYYTFNAIDSMLHLWRKGQAALPEVDLADLPQSRYFADIGWVTMHSQLGDKNHDIMLLLKSSPYGSASHSHNDQNAFVINAFGEPLAIQSGYRDWYDSAHHKGWTRLTQSKNAILIDGEGQPSKDPDAKGSIRHYFSGTGFTFTTGDAGPAYKKLATSALRHVFFINRRYFVMLDEVESRHESQFQWLLHAREKMQLDSAAGRIVSQKGNAVLDVTFLQPAASELQLTQTDQFTVPVDKNFSKGRPNEWHARAETKTAQRTGEFLSVLYPHKRGDAAATSVRLPAVKGYATQIDAADWQDLVLMARAADPQVSSAAGLLQGRAASISKRAGILSGFTLIDGTQLQSGALSLTSTQPLTLETRVSAAGWKLDFNPHPAAVLQLVLPFAPKAIKGVDQADWHFANGVLQLTLRENLTALEVLR